MADAAVVPQARPPLANSKSPTQLTSDPILLTLAVTAIPSTILLIQQWLLRQQNQTLKAKIGEVELEVPRNASPAEIDRIVNAVQRMAPTNRQYPRRGNPLRVPSANRSSFYPMSRRLALLISNNQYGDANLRKLAAPVADAAALATVLRDPAIGAFDEVQTLINGPANDVRHAIAAFFHGKEPTDLLLLYFSGHGLLDERSRLYLAGIAIKSGGNPTVRNNRINKNRYEAIWIYKGGGGCFEQNDLRDNQRGAWKIDDDCRPNVTQVGNVE